MADTDAAIDAAKKNLKLKEILVLKASIEVSDAISEKTGDTDAKAAYKHGCVAHKVISDEDGKIVRFKYKCAIRLADREAASNAPADELDDKDVVLEISTVYAVDYFMKDDMNTDELKKFGIINVGYHVWPFWREFVQSSCNRIGVSTIPLPFYQTPKID